MKKIHLGIRGGGVKTPSIGVLKALEEADIEVTSFSGASTGAIQSTLGALGKESSEILYLFKKYVEEFSKASILNGGPGSSIIEYRVNQVCEGRKFADLEKPLYITANQGGLLSPKIFLFSRETTPNVTLGEACRATCSFPFAYERYKLKIDNQNTLRFWDGGMAMNPFIPSDNGCLNILSTFRTPKVNRFSLYQRAWQIPEALADFIICTSLPQMGFLGTQQDIQICYERGYEEMKKLIPSLQRIINE